MKQGKVPGNIRKTLVDYLAGLEFFLAKLGQYNCQFLKAKTKLELRETFKDIIKRLQNALADQNLEWKAIWTDKITKAQKTQMETEADRFEVALTWFGRRSIIKDHEVQDAANSADTLIEILGKIQETLEKGEGWCL